MEPIRLKKHEIDIHNVTFIEAVYMSIVIDDEYLYLKESSLRILNKKYDLTKDEIREVHGAIDKLDDQTKLENYMRQWREEQAIKKELESQQSMEDKLKEAQQELHDCKVKLQKQIEKTKAKKRQKQAKVLGLTKEAAQEIEDVRPQIQDKKPEPVVIDKPDNSQTSEVKEELKRDWVAGFKTYKEEKAKRDQEDRLRNPTITIAEFVIGVCVSLVVKRCLGTFKII